MDSSRPLFLSNLWKTNKLSSNSSVILKKVLLYTSIKKLCPPDLDKIYVLGSELPYAYFKLEIEGCMYR